jgi:magnesium transporter
MNTDRASSPPPSDPNPTRRRRMFREPAPGAEPGTLLVHEEERPIIALIEYEPDRVVEKELASIEEVRPFLGKTDAKVWIDVRGISHVKTFHELGEIFKVHPLALEDVVNVPQRPKSDVYPNHQLAIARMVQTGPNDCVLTEQLGILFGEGFVVTIQEEAERDCLEPVRERIRKGRGQIRTRGSDYLAYALLDAVVDGFYPVLETLGERLEELEVQAAQAPHGISRTIHDVKRELLTVRRAIWPQRDLINGLLREDSPHITAETRVYLRDTYDHAVQVMDMVETYREIASGLMDLYLSGVSNRMNEIMKVLTIISTIFLPVTFIAGVYGMNFKTEVSPYNMPELSSPYGYPFSLALMAASVLGLLIFYRRKGWIEGGWFKKKRR